MPGETFSVQHHILPSCEFVWMAAIVGFPASCELVGSIIRESQASYRTVYIHFFYHPPLQILLMLKCCFNIGILIPHRQEDTIIKKSSVCLGSSCAHYWWLKVMRERASKPKKFIIQKKRAQSWTAPYVLLFMIHLHLNFWAGLHGRHDAGLTCLTGFLLLQESFSLFQTSRQKGKNLEIT